MKGHAIRILIYLHLHARMHVEFIYILISIQVSISSPASCGNPALEDPVVYTSLADAIGGSQESGLNAPAMHV